MRVASVLGVCLLSALAATAEAQSLRDVGGQLVHAFQVAPGHPVGGLARAADGHFYGMTARLLYRQAPDGSLAVVHTFDAESAGVSAPTIGPDGTVYGVVSQSGHAAVFRFEPETSAFGILHAFDTARDGLIIADPWPVGDVFRLTWGPDGRLYGTTNASGHDPLTASFHGTIYRVDPVTGAGETLHEFNGAAPALHRPVGGLVEVGGQLYGAARLGGNGDSGGLFRVDPATGAVTTIHLFASNVGGGRQPISPLTRTADGWLYGSTLTGGSSGQGVLYRFDPQAPGAGTQLLLIGSPLPEMVEAADGHLYCVDGPSVTRLRRSGGVHTRETVHLLSAEEGGTAVHEGLTVGLDGFLYGVTRTEGPHRAGSLFRFDPVEGGPAGNPSQFAVVQPFHQSAHDWQPSVPVNANNGYLYGTTSRGGATLRGAVYRFHRDTGALSMLGPMPGDMDVQTTTVNSDFVLAHDGLLYGTSSTVGTNFLDNRIVRVNPATGAVTTAAGGPANLGFGPSFDGLTLGFDGALYLTTQSGNTVTALRFDPATNGVTTVATRTAPRGFLAASRLVLNDDHELYVTIGSFEPLGSPFPSTLELARLDVGSGAFVTIAGPGNLPTLPLVAGLPARMPKPVALPNRDIVIPVQPASGPVVHLAVTPATGAVRTVCPGLGLLTTLAGPHLYSVDGPLRQCEIGIGTVAQEALPASFGSAEGSPASFGGEIHGAGTGGHYGGGTLFRITTIPLAPFDSDGDGLFNGFETGYGMDPFSAAGDDGAAGDPDGDGRTNAQELAAGTHPRGTFRRYFAEGATGPFFRMRLDLANPSATSAHVLLQFTTETLPITRYVLVPPRSHVSVDPASDPFMATAAFSTVVEADRAIGVERTMSWDPSGYGSHVETAVVAPSTTWYLAEGSTSGPFALFYLLQNPQPTAVDATVRYLRPSGQPPIDRTYRLRPRSRTTIVVDDQGSDLASTDVSAVITASAPIVAERAMYYSSPGQAFTAGHASAGVTAPALEWFLAEGATGAFFDLFVLIANPNASPAAVQVEYLLVGGGTLTKTYTVPGHSRHTIWVDDEQLPAGSGTRPFANTALSLVVRSTNGIPIVVERTMWWPGPSMTPDFWYETHNSPGATAAAARWLVAGGDVGGASGAQTYVLVANPTSTPGRVRVTVLDATGSHAGVDVDLPAKSRTNVPFTPGITGQFAVLVEALGADPVPIVVERATYGSPGGVLWSIGGNALASPMP